MNRVKYLCVAAALALASCSNDEVVEQAKENAIQFRTVVDLNTKGVETTTDNLQAIRVWANYSGGPDIYFADVKFKRDANNTFISDNKYYWPNDNSELGCYVVSDNFNVNVSFPSTFLIDNVIVDDDIRKQQDLVYGWAYGKKSEHEKTGLPLVLKHALSQIQINAKNDNSLYNYKVKGIRIAKVKNEGTFDGYSHNFDRGVKGEVKTYEVTYDKPIALQSDGLNIMGENTGNAMLISQQTTAWDTNSTGDAVTGSYISVLVNITTNTGAAVYPAGSTTAAETYGWATVPVDFNWKSGKKYIYTLDFTNGAGKVDPVDPGTDVDPGNSDPDKGKDILGSPIKFTVEVTGWDPENSNVEMSK